MLAAWNRNDRNTATNHRDKQEVVRFRDRSRNSLNGADFSGGWIGCIGQDIDHDPAENLTSQLLRKNRWKMEAG